MERETHSRLEGDNIISQVLPTCTYCTLPVNIIIMKDLDFAFKLERKFESPLR